MFAEDRFRPRLVRARLAGLPTPLANERVGNIGMIFWFMKAW
jgi:hypothetical protein